MRAEKLYGKYRMRARERIFPLIFILCFVPSGSPLGAWLLRLDELGGTEIFPTYSITAEYFLDTDGDVWLRWQPRQVKRACREVCID
jgi:hypothetical protein